MASIPDEIWRWVRGDTPDEEFGWWLEVASDEALGLDADQIRKLRGFDYEDPRGSFVFRDELVKTLPRPCRCVLYCDRQWLGIWTTTFPDAMERDYEELARRAPSLSLSRCRAMAHYWYVAFDSVDDQWFLERLSEDAARDILEKGIWPRTFDDFANVWPYRDRQQRSETPPKDFAGGVAMQLDEYMATGRCIISGQADD